MQLKRWAYSVWLVAICGFAVLHALHLSADFPNNTPWSFDFAKYTDEGWWANAAMRAHLFGHWRLAGDFNPAVAAPVLPFAEWIVFGFTGVSMVAARGLAVAVFFANLGLSYLLLRARGARWVALLALTLLVTSPFLYCFTRLALLEPMLTALMLAALNLAVRLPRFRHRARVSVAIGLLFTLMMLTKTTAVFLLPAIAWAMIAPLWRNRRVAVRSAAAALGTFAVTFGTWMALIAHFGLMRDYQYLFEINKYEKPTEWYWPLLSFWWSLRGALWADRILIPLAGVVLIGAALSWRRGWSRSLRRDPVFCSSALAAMGYILFMTYQNHPQPRYYAVVAFFSVFVLAMGVEALWLAAKREREGASESPADPRSSSGSARRAAWNRFGGVALGGSLVAAGVIATGVNAVWTLNFALRPEYTLVPAAEKLTRYIDEHPNGKRLLLSTSSDEITMISHLPTICDDLGTQDLVSKLKVYQPGWFASWNVVDPGTLEDLHSRYSLEQVATFHALDHPDRNVLVLFKLHPLADGRVRQPEGENLQAPLPGDKIDVPIE